MKDPTQLKTLVLNADMSPIGMFPELVTIPARDAVAKVLTGNCFVVSEYDKKIGCQSLDMNWPAVIARKEYDKIEEKVSFSRYLIFLREGGQCAYCGTEFTSHNEVTFDHVLPRHAGGKTEWSNIVAACGPCNRKKGHKMPEGEWKPKIKPYEPNIWKLRDLRRKFPVHIGHESWLDYIPNWEGEIKIIQL